MDNISDLLLGVVGFFEKGDFGPVLLTSFLTTLAVRVYRLPAVQDRLPSRLKWDKGILAWIIVGAFSILVPAAVGFFTGTPFLMALTQAIPMVCNYFVASGLVHKSTQLLGEALPESVTQPENEVAKKVSSLVFGDFPKLKPVIPISNDFRD